MPLTLTPPTKPGKAYVVVESSAGAPVQRDKIALDPYSGEVVESVRFTDGPLLAQLTTIGILAHTGTLFGSSSQIAMTAMALGILAVIFWGYRMWWQRRPTGGAPRPLERRGVLATTPQPVLFGLVLGPSSPVGCCRCSVPAWCCSCSPTPSSGGSPGVGRVPAHMCVKM